MSGDDASLWGLPITNKLENLERYVFIAFPWLIFVQRWVKKYASFYTRALILGFGAAIFLFRQLRGYLGNMIKDYMMSRAETKEGDDVYYMLLSWISEQHFAKSARNFLATVEKDKRSQIDMVYGLHRGRGNPDDKKVDNLSYTPSIGLYPFWHKGNLFFFERDYDKRNPTIAGNDKLAISCFGRNPQCLKELLEECREAFNSKDEGKTVIYHPNIRYTEGSWVRGMARTKRDIASVVMDTEIKASLIKDLGNYFNIKQQTWYAARGIPYRRGYLLHGPPGTGKSSLTIALAGYFNLKVYVVNLNAPKLDEDVLTQLFASLPAKCIVLMEDIDAAGMTNARTKSESRRDAPKISLSGLLNTIDGVSAQEGRVLIMTTNHIQKLDSALIRPGRVDMMIEFRNADEAQLIQIFEGIYSKRGIQDDELEVDVDTEKAYTEKITMLATQFAANIPKKEFSPAEIQGYLLRWKDEPEMAVENAAEWATETTATKADVAAAQLKEEEEEEVKSAKVDNKSLQKMILQTQIISQEVLRKRENDSVDINGEWASTIGKKGLELEGAIAAQIIENPSVDINGEEASTNGKTSPKMEGSMAAQIIENPSVKTEDYVNSDK